MAGGWGAADGNPLEEEVDMIARCSPFLCAHLADVTVLLFLALKRNTRELAGEMCCLI